MPRNLLANKKRPKNLLKAEPVNLLKKENRGNMPTTERTPSTEPTTSPERKKQSFLQKAADFLTPDVSKEAVIDIATGGLSVPVTRIERYEKYLPEEDIKKYGEQVGKSALKGTLQAFASVGDTVQWFSEWIPEARDYEGSEKERKVVNKISEFGSKVGKEISEYWNEKADNIQLDPEIFQGEFIQNPSFTRASALIAQAIPSLAAATAITFATKNPLAGASALGFIEGSQTYTEAREAGKEVRESAEMALASSIGTTVLETLPLTTFLKGGKLTKQAFEGAIQEGSEEALQALYQNIIAKFGYDNTRKLTQGMIEGLIAGAGSGGVIGSVTAGRGRNTDQLIQEAQEAGVSPEEIEAIKESAKNQIINNAEKIEEKLDVKKENIEKLEQGELELEQPIQETQETDTGQAEQPQTETDGGQALIEQKEQPQQIESERVPLSNKLEEIRDRYKRPETIARWEAKKVQEEIIETLETSNLTANDKAKFIRTIKNIQTEKQFNKEFPQIINRVVKLEQAQQKRDISKQIKKELKFTKPVKKGQKRVEKFDYESSKTLRQIRGLNKLTKNKAQQILDNMPTENLSEVDKIRARVLSYKANGAEGSIELHRRVLQDIQTLKKLGSEAKNEAELAKKIERGENIEEFKSAVQQNKANKKSLKTKIGNVYRRGFSNFYSLINSIASKELAEKYDPEILQADKYTSIYYDVERVTNTSMEIQGLSNKQALTNYFSEMKKEEGFLIDRDGVRKDVSKLQLIDIYNSIKNDLIRERYYNAYGQAQIDAAISNGLTDADRKMADSWMNEIQQYRQIFNERHIEITGRDLGTVENYWPSTSEFIDNVYDDIKLQGETPSAMKARSKSPKVMPEPKDAWLKFQKHIAEARHEEHLSRHYETLKRMFRDRKLKGEIINKYGKKVYKVLMDQVENISLHNFDKRLDDVSQLFGKMINNWVTAKVAMNPTVFARQLASVINYAENMPAGTWTVGFGRSVRHPKKTFDFMWRNSPYLKARYNMGYSEALQRAVKGANEVSQNMANWRKGLASFVRAGDITAIIYGGEAYVRYLEKQGMSRKEAFREFEKATLKAQQSPFSTGLSQFQNSKSPFARIYLAFKNSNSQAFRKMADSIIQNQRGEITTTQLGKNLMIYGVMRSVFYIGMGALVKEGWGLAWRTIRGRRRERDDEKNYFEDIILNIGLSPVNAIPLLDDLSEFALRKIAGKKTYMAVSTPINDDINMALNKFKKKNLTFEDYLDMVSVPVELTSGLPIQTVKRYTEKALKGRR